MMFPLLFSLKLDNDRLDRVWIWMGLTKISRSVNYPLFIGKLNSSIKLTYSRVDIDGD